MSQGERPVPGNLLSMLANPRQARLDRWSELVESLQTLKRERRPDECRRLRAHIAEAIGRLGAYERLWLYPGVRYVAALQKRVELDDAAQLVTETRAMVRTLGELGDEAAVLDDPRAAVAARYQLHGVKRPRYFTVIYVDTMPPEEMMGIRRGLAELRRPDQDLIYEVLFVSNMEDALDAALANEHVQACVMAHDFPAEASERFTIRAPQVDRIIEEARRDVRPRSLLLAEVLRGALPHLDLYLRMPASIPAAREATHHLFRRVFYRYESSHELHVSLIDGVRDRFETPFFDALRHYAERPIGNFHALPIARGHSVLSSNWIVDMAEFYGTNLFMAESSATSGGLDSLLEPTGALKEAQAKAARAFGAQRTFFVTNGTSTANKIALQALVQPGDIVLIDRNCHKSHHYGLMLAGAHPVYLDAYPLQPFAFYGGVPLSTIKEALATLERAGRLDRVKLLLLTNCTFDGITYHPLRVMEEVLAIKPDMIFLWDEAWYAFAGLHPLARQRTAMHAARTLVARRRNGGGPRVRVYATQSTHKSLSAFRQGSMLHVWDDDFERKVAEAFTEAYFTHTSTSPNYQILASLDLARRQAELEGYSRVQAAYQQALELRARVAADPLLAKYFRLLEPRDLVPSGYAGSGLDSFVGGGEATAVELMNAWGDDEFVLDPTRMTLYLAQAGIDGNHFKTAVLMDRYGIQVNKTSINSVLFNCTIGVTWGALAYLLDILRREAERIDGELRQSSAAERAQLEERVARLRDRLPALPDFSAFHPAFRPSPRSPEGDLRSAFFLAYDERNREYVPLAQALAEVKAGRELVSTNFVVPYPPGFPVLVPGQLVSAAILEFILALDVKEIHGYQAALGLCVFRDEVLRSLGRGGRAWEPAAEEPRLH